MSFSLHDSIKRSIYSPWRCLGLQFRTLFTVGNRKDLNEPYNSLSLGAPHVSIVYVLLCWVQWDVRMRLHTSTLLTVCAACSLLGLQASLPSCSLCLLCETLALEWRLWMTTFLPWFTSHTTGVSIPWATAWMPVKFPCSEISPQQPGVECVHSPYTCVCKQIQTICVSNVTHIRAHMQQPALQLSPGLWLQHCLTGMYHDVLQHCTARVHNSGRSCHFMKLCCFFYLFRHTVCVIPEFMGIVKASSLAWLVLSVCGESSARTQCFYDWQHEEVRFYQWG